MKMFEVGVSVIAGYIAGVLSVIVAHHFTYRRKEEQREK